MNDLKFNEVEKEILYNNPKKGTMTLKQYKSAHQALILASFEAMLANDYSMDIEKRAKELRYSEATIKLMQGDEFNLEVAYAMLYLELLLGSKRKREMYIKRQCGELLTPENYNTLVIMLAMQNLRMTHSQYQEYVHSIYASEVKAK